MACAATGGGAGGVGSWGRSTGRGAGVGGAGVGRRDEGPGSEGPGSDGGTRRRVAGEAVRTPHFEAATSGRDAPLGTPPHGSAVDVPSRPQRACTTRSRRRIASPMSYGNAGRPRRPAAPSDKLAGPAGIIDVGPNLGAPPNGGGPSAGPATEPALARLGRARTLPSRFGNSKRTSHRPPRHLLFYFSTSKPRSAGSRGRSLALPASRGLDRGV